MQQKSIAFYELLQLLYVAQNCGVLFVNFYEKYVRLCNSVNKAPSAVAVELGIKKSTVTRWKQGNAPSFATVVKVADYFGCTTEDLLSEEKQKPVLPDGLNAETYELVMRFLAATPDQQQLVLGALRAFGQDQQGGDRK